MQTRVITFIVALFATTTLAFPQALSQKYQVTQNIQQTIDAAGDNGFVVIPPTYPGRDSYVNKYHIPIVDLRPGSGRIASVVTPEMFGALGDGIHDDGDAIRKALRSGAPRVLLAPGRTYLVKTLEDRVVGSIQFAFDLHSNQELAGGPGTVIKFADGVFNNDLKQPAYSGGAGFNCKNSSSIYLHDFEMDMNGSHNLVPQNSIRMGYGISLSNCSNSVIEHLYIHDNPGRNSIVAGGGGSGTQNLIQGNVVSNSGTAMPANVYQVDYSAIYVDSTYTRVLSNQILNANYPSTNCGGIELHGDGDVADGNKIQKSVPGIWVASDNESNATSPLSSIRVTHNECDDCLVGVAFAGKYDFKDVEIQNNILNIRPNSLGKLANVTAIGILTLHDDTGYFNYTLRIFDSKITGNTINDVAPLPRAESAAGIVLTSLNHVEISGNTIGPIAGVGIIFRGSPYGMTDVKVTQNSVSAGYITSGYGLQTILINFTGSSIVPQKSAFDASDLVFDGNILKTPNSAGQAFYFEWSGQSQVSNLVIGSGNSYIGVGRRFAGPQAASPAIQYN